MSIQAAQYPGSVWNGLTPNDWRDTRNSDVDPNFHDWDQLAAEMIAVQTALNAGTASSAAKTSLIGQPTDTYAATMTIDVTKSSHVISGVSGTSATVALTPSAAGTKGDFLEILTEADASGTVTATFASTFHSSGTQATTASHFSSIAFRSDGTRWVELYRTTNLA